jgi:hypothetical protein
MVGSLTLLADKKIKNGDEKSMLRDRARRAAAGTLLRGRPR